MEIRPELVPHLLKEIKTCRPEMARDFVTQDGVLNHRQATIVVDDLIQRLVFQRICEELLAAIPNARKEVQKDHLREWKLSRPSAAVQGLLKTLAAPRWNSLFRRHGAELLGEIYEYFVGREIGWDEPSLHSGAPPETKKTRGIYYTPRVLVDYVTSLTVTAPEPFPTRPFFTILDPACGSGAILLGVYQRLLDWYHAAYVKQLPRSAAHLYQTTAGEWRLTLIERQRILLDHIYGVDLDAQAAEVAKRSLLVKMYEELLFPVEGKRTFATPEAFLNDLSDNIKCGNSLLGSDFRPLPHPVAGEQGSLDSQRLFNWPAEFPHILGAGGFDAIVGNPPYVNVRQLAQTQDADVKKYLAANYQTARGNYDLYVLFVERSFHLLKTGGRCGLIVPNKIATLDYAAECRRMLLEQTSLDEIVDLAQANLFPQAGVYPYVIVWTKQPPSPTHAIRTRQIASPADCANDIGSTHIPQASLSPSTGFAIHGTLDVESRVPTQPLGERSMLHSGTTGFTAEQTSRLLREWAEVRETPHFEFIVSGNIDRYQIIPGNVRFIKRRFERPVLPLTEQMNARKRSLYAATKIVIAGMTLRLEAAYDEQGLALGVQVFAVTDMQDDSRYILGLLNSKLLSYLFRLRYQAKRLAGGYLAINLAQLAKLPIRVLDLQQPSHREKQRQIVELVESLSDQNATADQELDRLVYELYALTPDEITAVEQSPI